MKNMVGLLLVISGASHSYALTETVQKISKGVQDLKTNLQNAAGAFSAGNTTEAAEHLNKAIIGAREAAADVMSTNNAVKDIVPKVETTKEALKAVSEDTAKAHGIAQNTKEAVKSALESSTNNDCQAAQKHQEVAYDLVAELVSDLESIKNRTAELHQKAEKIGEAVQPKTTYGAKPFFGWFE